MHNKLRAGLLDASRVLAECAELLPDQLVQASHAMAGVLTNGGKVMFCGNGGSAADSQHIAAELTVRLDSRLERPALFGLDLTANSSELTACANDYDFREIFVRKLEACGRTGDMLVGLSTSGMSQNIVKAFEKSREMGIITLLLSGSKGGCLATLADHSLLVPATDVMRIQEAHIAIAHLLIGSVEEILFTNGEKR